MNPGGIFLSLVFFSGPAQILLKFQFPFCLFSWICHTLNIPRGEVVVSPLVTSSILCWRFSNHSLVLFYLFSDFTHLLLHPPKKKTLMEPEPPKNPNFGAPNPPGAFRRVFVVGEQHNQDIYSQDLLQMKKQSSQQRTSCGFFPTFLPLAGTKSCCCHTPSSGFIHLKLEIS